MTTASEKLKALDLGLGDETKSVTLGYVLPLRSVLPQIVAVVEAAEQYALAVAMVETGEAPSAIHTMIELTSALAALDEALS